MTNLAVGQSRPVALAFDWGETLAEYKGVPLNWRQHYPQALNAAAIAMGSSVDVNQSQRASEILLEYNTRENPRTTEVEAELIFTKIAEVWSAESGKLDSGIDAFFEYFQQRRSVYSDVIQTLTYFKGRQVPIGILTDTPYGMPTQHMVKEITESGVAPFIDCILTSVDVGFRKPQPEGVMRIAERLGVPTRDLRYIGNEEKDVRAANAAGAISILIARADSAASYEQRVTISSLTELIGEGSEVM